MMELNYVYKNNFVYNASALVKLLILLNYLILAFLFNNPVYLVILLLNLFLFSILAKSFRKCLRFARYIVIIGFFIFILNIILNRTGNTRLISVSTGIPLIGNITVTLESITFSLISILQLFLVLYTFALVNVIINPDDLMKSFIKLKMPYVMTLLVSLSIRFFPLLMDDLKLISDVQRSRGFELDKGNWFTRLKKRMVLLLPLLTNSLERSVQVSEALESRAFGTKPSKVFYHEIRIKKIDYLTIILNFSILGILLYFVGNHIGIISIFPQVSPLVFTKFDIIALSSAFFGNIALLILIKARKPDIEERMKNEKDDRDENIKEDIKESEKENKNNITNRIETFEESAKNNEIVQNGIIQNGIVQNEIVNNKISKKLIEIRNLTFCYNDRSVPSLQNINLQINRGEFILITGPSGSGKSTLIRTFNGLIPHFYGGKIEGTVKIQDMNVLDTSTRILAGKVGMIFQNPENQLFMNNIENEVAFGMENLNFTRKKMQKRMEEILNSFELKQLRKREIPKLSGGEKQKVAIASVIAMDPEILILDEPTAELDPKSADEVLSLVKSLKDMLGLTVILIEHRIDRVLQYADRVIIMNDGKILEDGKPSEVFYNHINLNELGVTTPPLIQFHKLIKQKFANFPETPFTEDESRAVLKKILKEKAPKLWNKGSENFIIASGSDNFPLYHAKFKQKPVLIKFEKVNFSYQKNTPILRDINFEVREGEFLSIIGRNGSGKTTLLKLINGLLRPNSGNITVNGSNVAQKSIAQIAKDVGYIFQNPSVQFYQDTLKEDMSFVLNNFEYEDEDIERIINETLTQFNLSEFINTYARYLSIGQQQKSALATVIAIHPKILILDEPTHGMDYKQKTILMHYLDEYRKQGNVIILVSHDVETIAEFSDRIILLSEGKIVIDDLKRNVLSKFPLFWPQITRLIHSFENIPNNILNANELEKFIEENSVENIPKI